MVDPKIISLIAVAEMGSFSQAAQKLAITQPAISQHIKALEDELNIKIFDRTSKHILLTPQGEKIVKCAKKIIGLEKNLIQELNDSKNFIDHLTIGITHTAESNPIIEALAKYCADNMNISINVVTDTTKNLYNLLRSYEIDVAIVEEKVVDSAIKYISLDNDYLCLAASPNHPFVKKGIATLDELKKEKMILRSSNSSTRNLFDAHLESKNMNINEFNVILQVDNVATIKDLIMRDFGVSILPRSVCLNEIKKGKIVIVPIKNLTMTREINIAYQSDFVQTNIFNDIIKIYHDVLDTYK